jgi:hypothetical protein
MLRRCAVSTVVGVVCAASPHAVSAQEPLEYPNDYFDYSFDVGNCSASGLRDPVTLEFLGSAAKLRVLAGYERGGPFADDVDGDITGHTIPHLIRHNTDNLFKQASFGSCSENSDDTDLADREGYGESRTHLRMWQLYTNYTTPDAGNNNGATGPLVKLTPHIEDWHPHNSGENDCGGWPGPINGSHAVERGAKDRGPDYYERAGSGFDRGRRFFQRAYQRASHRHRMQFENEGNTRSVKQCDREYAGSNGTLLKIGIGKYQCFSQRDRLDERC